jgi:hypothetical protein
LRGRLHIYERRWRYGVQVTPHQQRHSCAALLLNAEAFILTVQAMLGHRHVDATLSYARLYDSTIAAHCYRSMGKVEERPGPLMTPRAPLIIDGQLVQLDELRARSLNITH